MKTLTPAAKSSRDIDFSRAQHDVWATLYGRQLPKVRKYACRDYLTGFDILEMTAERIPTMPDLNAKITPPTGWRTVRTAVRYSDAVPWYHHFGKKQFLITDYMRTREELDFTPEPDMFHDIFGHLPFMVHPHYTDLQEMFAPAFLRANDEERENIKKLAWFSTEFGLIREEGQTKIFGAGLISSAGEIEHVMNGGVPIQGFTIENVLEFDKAIWNFNECLFEFESITSLKTELARYFDSV